MYINIYTHIYNIYVYIYRHTYIHLLRHTLGASLTSATHYNALQHTATQIHIHIYKYTHHGQESDVCKNPKP